MAMTNTANLRALAFEKFIGLLLGRDKGDQRTAAQLRQAAARAVVREQRIANKSSNVSHGNNAHAGNGFEALFQKVWGICQRMAHYADQRTNMARSHICIEPTIDTNPIVADEPVNKAVSEHSETVVTFPVVTGNGRQTIPDSEFPNRFGAADEVTNNWRASCELNNRIRAERDRRSAQHRQQSKYLG
jgi:hypothetical protein